MTLTELADRVGITLANLSILKTGKARAIRFSTLKALRAALLSRAVSTVRESVTSRKIGLDAEVG